MKQELHTPTIEFCSQFLSTQPDCKTASENLRKCMTAIELHNEAKKIRVGDAIAMQPKKRTLFNRVATPLFVIGVAGIVVGCVRIVMGV